MEVCCIVLAAGSGSRFGGQKQFVRIGGIPIVERSIITAKQCADLVVAVRPQGIMQSSAFAGADVVVEGGATRSESVRAGLAVIPPEVCFVLVHDGTRPFADAKLYERVLTALRGGAEAVVPVVPLTDTLKRVRGDLVAETVERARMGIVQTPQGFTRAAAFSAHRKEADADDDASRYVREGLSVETVEGEVANIKITYPSDLVIAGGIAESGGSAKPVVVRRGSRR